MSVDHMTNISTNGKESGPSSIPPGFLLPISPPPPPVKLRVEGGGTSKQGKLGSHIQNPLGKPNQRMVFLLASIHCQFIQSIYVAMCLKYVANLCIHNTI